MITHVVLMKFTDPHDGARAKILLEGLAAQIPALTSLTVGLDVMQTSASYDLCLITTHESMELYGSYQDHPKHQEVLGWLRPRLADRALVDYES